jgi:transcriptional regulator with XRE-family HTH domain
MLYWERGETVAENTDLPFNQIKKSEIPLINSNTSLFIIGNGFDLMHKVPSSYYNFRDFLGKNNRLRNVLENYIKRDDLWADFEESLAYIDDDAMLATTNDMMDIFDVKDQFDDDFSAADFFVAAEAAIEPAQTIMRELQRQFKEWVSTLERSNSAKPLIDILSNKSKFINFNYTEFLETIYEISKKNIWYIHGDRRDKNTELILGHAPEAQFEEEIDLHKSKNKDWKIKNQTEYDLRETAGYGLIEYYDATTKKSADVIKDNKDKFEKFRYVEDVVVIGHSLSQVDYPYFKEIIKYNQNAADMNWHISWYSSGDLKRIKQFVSEMNISNSKVKIFRT